LMSAARTAWPGASATRTRTIAARTISRRIFNMDVLLTAK
jgi:hypothetical protein